MKNILMIITIGYMMLNICPANTTTNLISKGAILSFLTMHDVAPNDMDEDRRIRQGIMSAGPEFADLLQELIKENSHNQDIIGGSLRLLSLKYGGNKTFCRDFLLRNRALFNSAQPGIQVAMVANLGQFGQSEDAPLLVNIFQSSEDPMLRLMTAKALKLIGSEKELIEMKRIFADMKAKEPLRREKVLKNLRNQPGYKVSDTNSLFSTDSIEGLHLGLIAKEIADFEKRILKTKASTLPVW